MLLYMIGSFASNRAPIANEHRKPVGSRSQLIRERGRCVSGKIVSCMAHLVLKLRYF